MSYIHDALRKSEDERRRYEEAITASEPGIQVPAPASGYDTGRYVVIASVLVLTGFLASVSFWLQGTEEDTQGSAVVTTSRPSKGQSAASTIPADLTQQAGLQGKGTIAEVPKTFNETPFLWELEAPLPQRIGELVVSIHVYATIPSQRILFLNDHEYRQGERMSNGVLVVEIVSEGVLLAFQGRHFKLPRPR
ncbi:MAG: hypothetical protein BMS9Abin36_2198 [Gammaproteobacteria bacterium]|nr:MAG: hypothetical protein BMS9Abin36_2198 [Gammaproteobacteria bacterium]